MKKIIAITLALAVLFGGLVFVLNKEEASITPAPKTFFRYKITLTTSNRLVYDYLKKYGFGVAFKGKQPAPAPEPKPEQPETAVAPAPEPKPEPAPEAKPKQPAPAPEAKPKQPAPAPMPAPKPAPAPKQPAPTPVEGLTADEQKMVNLINQERVKAGLKPYEVNMKLVKSARVKSQDMITRNYFAHNSPDGKTPWDLIKAQGVTHTMAGENLAGAPDVETAHKNLMNSPGHRANILHSSFAQIGIGIVSGGKYGKMFTQHFVK